jgi:hypothetical protein
MACPPSPLFAAGCRGTRPPAGKSLRVLTDVPPIPPTARAPPDDHIFALARAGHADHLVSGDNDLLSLGRFEGIAILPPAAYARLRGEALPPIGLASKCVWCPRNSGIPATRGVVQAAARASRLR